VFGRGRLACALLAALFTLSVALPTRTFAQNAPSMTFWFAGTRLIFDSPVALDGEVAVSVRDSGLGRLLARVGATISYQAQQRYVVITTADRRIVIFTIGDTRYSIAGVTANAPFAPFYDGNDVIVPLYAIARALYVEPVVNGSETVFEPEIGALDVRPDGRRTVVTLHGATALKYVKANESPERLTVTFGGIGSGLTQNRRVGGGVDEVDVAVSGGVKNPTSTVTIVAPKGSGHLIQTPASPYDFSVVFAPAGVALDANPDANANAGAPQPAPRGAPAPPAPRVTAAPMRVSPPPVASEATPEPSPAAEPQNTPQSGAATITDVAVETQADGGVNVRLSIDGTAAFEWHRLRDDRWYLDIANATLAPGPRDERPNSAAVEAVRIRQIGTAAAPVVRVAFSTHGDRHIDVTPSDRALAIAVGSAIDDDDVARTGNGQIGGATVAQSTVESPAAPPAAPIAPQPETTAWKFGPPAVEGSRLIVIDPGHGGDDAGTAHNGLVEKNITLDISQRLRALLTQAGWIVKLTRETDIDPVSPNLLAAFGADGRPNSSDRAYLQTRCDVANNANARLFISIHVNYADATSVRGTTFYYSKIQDVPLAQALERSVIPLAGTQDDGVVKSNLYVTKHTTMPAVLIETGFISNPGDVRLLGDPAFLQNLAAGIAAGVKAYAGAVPTLSKSDQ
jgi:N-acetylmuramoyl-L-alanine amidase